MIKKLKTNGKSVLKANNQLMQKNEHCEAENAELKEELNKANELNQALYGDVARLEMEIEELEEGREADFDDFKDIRNLIIKATHPDKNHELLNSQQAIKHQRYNEFVAMLLTYLWNGKQ